jgi:GT2 family glycosyltransferase
MSVACVILNYNDHITTSTLVSNIVDYTSINHIVIVDNASTDDSLHHLSKLVSGKTHLISSTSNGGYGKGNNLGIRYATEKLNVNFVIIANPDVDFDNSTINECLNVLKQNENIFSVAPIMKDTNKKITKKFAWKLVDGFLSVLNMSVIFSRFLSNKYLYDVNILNSESKFVEVDVLPGSLFVMKTHLLNDSEFFDSDLFLYNEEEVIAEKIVSLGYVSALILNRYYIHNHSVSISKSYKSFYSRKKLQLLSRKIYLNKYKKFSKKKMLLADVFFIYCKIEFLMLRFFKSLRGG